MGILQGVGSIIGGNAAAGAIGKQQRRNIRDIKRGQAEQEAVNAPFLSRGTEGFNALADAIMSGPGELSDPEQMFLDDIRGDVLGDLSARGLSDSGMGINALAQALMRGRITLRQNRLGELATLSGFGADAANRFNQIGQFGTAGRIGARNALGEANAFAKMNMFNQFGGIGENLFGSLDPKSLLAMFSGGAGGLSGAMGAGAGAGMARGTVGGFA